MKIIGIIVSLVSTICLLIALNMSTAVTTRSSGFGDFRIPSMTVNNLGLMQDKQNYIITSAVFLIIGVGLYLFALKNGESKHIGEKPLQSQSDYDKRDFTKYNTVRAPNETRFSGDKELTNDAYKIYLVNKFKVTKNDVFGKYVYQEKLFDSLDELLIILNTEENNKYQSSVNTTNLKSTHLLQQSSNNTSTFTLKNKLIGLGYIVNESTTSDGKTKYEVKKGTTVEYFYSAEEFAFYAISLI